MKKKKKNSKNNNISKTNPKKVTSNRKKQQVKKKKNNYIGIILFIVVFLLNILAIFEFNSIKKKIFSPILLVDKVYLENDSKVVIEYKTINYNIDDKVYCLFLKDKDIIDLPQNGWILSSNNRCEYELDKNIYYTYIKGKEDNIIYVDETSKFGVIKNLKINENKYYLASNDTLQLKVLYDKLGYVDNNIEWISSNENVATVDNGLVKAKKDGTVNITATIMNQSVSSNIIVTNLITERPDNGFDFKKENLTCNNYTESENDLLDTILQFKVNRVGYKTRASVVEAARFLTLDFPYRINYFYENGRLTQKNKIDGEGRYYHKGLYLDESRYDNISKSRKGPKTWGCSLYSVPDHKKSRNGLDCSGFVSWALLNGGFNPGDIGAGTSKYKDLTDIGTKKKLTTSLANSSTIKVGDLLHNTLSGGHIAIIVGIDNEYYYVAQAVWFDEIGVIINKYKKSNLKNRFKEVILMDKYYKNDGDLTNMW